MSLASAYTKCTNKDAKAGSYMIVGLDSKKKVSLIKEGVGLGDMKDNLDEKLVLWAAINVHGVDVRANVSSTRVKVLQVNWVGGKVPAMKRMQALAGKQLVAKIFKGVAMSMDCNKAEEITAEGIVKSLLAAGGAHKPTYYQMGEAEAEKVAANFYDPANK